MAKASSIFVCTNCDAQYPKWQGRCTECGKWGTIVEQGIKTSAEKQSSGVRPGEVVDLVPHAINATFMTTKVPELDQVFGGGIVPGSLILLGGEPGVGKSTLVLQLARVLLSEERDVLYVSGEESAEQVGQRLHRLPGSKATFGFLAERDAATIISTIRSRKPAVVVVDSIHTLASSDVPSEAGSVAQVRLVTNLLLQTAKSLNIAILIVGHVTKDGSMAGPKALEHLVDVVLYLEGDPSSDIRLLRSVKNRFGSTQHVSVFRMAEDGLRPVANPSAVFLGERQPAAGAIAGITVEGRRPFAVEVQALTSPTAFGLPRRTASGFDLNRLHVLLAVLGRRAGMKQLANQDVFVNVVGGLKIQERAADAAICLAVVSSLKDFVIPITWAAVGEVGLGGELRTVTHLESRLREGKLAGCTDIIIPKTIKLPKMTGLRLHQVANVTEALQVLPGYSR